MEISLVDKLAREAVEEMMLNISHLADCDIEFITSTLELKIRKAVKEVREKLTLSHRLYDENCDALIDKFASGGYNLAVQDLEDIKKTI